MAASSWRGRAGSSDPGRGMTSRSKTVQSMPLDAPLVVTYGSMLSASTPCAMVSVPVGPVALGALVAAAAGAPGGGRRPGRRSRRRTRRRVSAGRGGRGARTGRQHARPHDGPEHDAESKDLPPRQRAARRLPALHAFLRQESASRIQ